MSDLSASPQFVYFGEHEETELWGLTFPRGTAVPVFFADPKENAHVLAKLRGNPEFNEVIDGAEVVMPARKKPGPKPKRAE